jgi:hypothetical protein
MKSSEFMIEDRVDRFIRKPLTNAVKQSGLPVTDITSYNHGNGLFGEFAIHIADGTEHMIKPVDKHMQSNSVESRHAYADYLDLELSNQVNSLLTAIESIPGVSEIRNVWWYNFPTSNNLIMRVGIQLERGATGHAT